MDSQSSQILLKGTSSMSLDERFTMMLQNRQAPLLDTRDTVPQQLTASASLKNQWLVQEIANRPSVMAALRIPWSVKQQQFKGTIKARLGRRMLRGGLHDMSKFWEMPKGRGRGKGFLMKGPLAQKLNNRSMMEEQHEPYISRGQLTQSQRLRGTLRGKGMQTVGCGLAERNAKPDCRNLLTREELDAQLDEYMSRSKSHLDAQLDAYMAEVDSENLL